MSMFAEAARQTARGRGLRCAVLLGSLAAVALPLTVLSEDYDDRGGKRVSASVQPKAGARAKGTNGYELRCWQYGRLILEEHFLQAPPESSSDVLRMHDEAGSPVRVLETANATCLLKAVSKPPRTIRP